MTRDDETFLAPPGLKAAEQATRDDWERLWALLKEAHRSRLAADHDAAATALYRAEELAWELTDTCEHVERIASAWGYCNEGEWLRGEGATADRLAARWGKKEHGAACPRCGAIAVLGALSRTDNETMICDGCGVAEGLETEAGKEVLPQSKWHAAQAD